MTLDTIYKMAENKQGNMQAMQLIFDHMPYLAWMKDHDGKYVVINRAFANFFGKTDEEIIGKTMMEILPSDIVIPYQQIDDKVIQYKKTQYVDHIYHQDETGTKWFDTCVIPLLDEKDQCNGTIGFSRKISRRKKLEIELKNKEIFLKTMLDTIPDLIFYKDINSIMLGCNKTCSEMVYGTNEENVIGKTISELVQNNDFANSCLADDRKTFESNKMLKREEQIRLIDGSVLDVETEKIPFYDEQGKVAGLIAISRDITDRKRFEHELLERERHAKRELALAARMQENSLPQPFGNKNLKVSSVFSPYHIVSGDLINYKWLAEQDKLCGYVVDVSGHGVATALQAATIKMLLDRILLSGQMIDEKEFQHINQRMLEYLSEESFVALLYFEFDFQTRILTIISAGINLFLVAEPDQCTLVPIFSCYLGLFDKADIQKITIPFKPGEIYCMMSDGLSDLIEMHGTSMHQDIASYNAWLGEMTKNPDRRDDCSAICIEILRNDTESYILHINNDEELVKAQQSISEFLIRNIPNHADALEVGINEALNNGYSIAGAVHVKMKRFGGTVIVRVKDDGPGFDTNETNQRLRKKMCHEDFDDAFEDLLLEEGGRGILLMKMLCDRLIYNAKGNEILLMKKI